MEDEGLILTECPHCGVRYRALDVEGITRCRACGNEFFAIDVEAYDWWYDEDAEDEGEEL